MQYLVSSYDPWVVVASLFVAVLASYVALELAKRERSEDRVEALAWWLGGSLAMGTGIFSMHFIGMLAYSLPIQLGYGKLLTFASWIAAVAVSGIALWVAGRGSLKPSRLAWSASAMAAGICTMHYTGMAAIDLAPGIVWNPWLVVASAVIAFVASGAALRIFFWLRQLDACRGLYQALAAVLMGLAITGMHYTGMAAVNVPAGAVCLSVDGIKADGMALLLLLSTSGMLALTLLTSLHSKARRLAKSLRIANEQLQCANGALKQQALMDPLTGLANRVLFEDRLQHAIAGHRRHAAARATKLAILFIDLDGFKPVNDSCGHQTGDLVLKMAAQRLLQFTRASDTVARVGGDEFLILMEELNAVADAEGLARRVVDGLSLPFELSPERNVRISASVGIVIHPDHGDADKLVVHADAAMYSAKRSGGATYAVYEPHMDAHASEQAELVGELRQAIARGELSLHYQPKINVRSGTAVGFEALLRWQHSERGAVPPNVFIPLAERFGMILSLGNWVIEEACRQLREWAGSGLTVRIAINVSAIQLRQADFVERVEAALRRHGVAPSQLLCEITESAAMEDLGATRRTFEGLGSIGVFLSIDDFGTGYSSLSCLRQLPARQLKIDRSFVQDIAVSGDARAVVDAVVRLSHALGLSVVAEGVETKEQCDILARLGCDELQGFFFARPMPAAELAMWNAPRQRESCPAAVARAASSLAM